MGVRMSCCVWFAWQLSKDVRFQGKNTVGDGLMFNINKVCIPTQGLLLLLGGVARLLLCLFVSALQLVLQQRKRIKDALACSDTACCAAPCCAVPLHGTVCCASPVLCLTGLWCVLASLCLSH